MLNEQEIAVAVVMMKRAQCRGEEAAAVATVIQKLEHEYAKLTAPKTDVPVVEADEE
jgi:hypothetical protein